MTGSSVVFQHWLDEEAVDLVPAFRKDVAARRRCMFHDNLRRKHSRYNADERIGRCEGSDISENDIAGVLGGPAQFAIRFFLRTRTDKIRRTRARVLDAAIFLVASV